LTHKNNTNSFWHFNGRVHNRAGFFLTYQKEEFLLFYVSVIMGLTRCCKKTVFTFIFAVLVL